MLIPIEMRTQESAPNHATVGFFEGINPFAVKIKSNAPTKEHKKTKKNFLRFIDFQILVVVFSTPSSITEAIRRNEKMRK